MKFRFRKSLTIIPGVLKWTVSKKSTSLNLNLGLFSRSWGTRGTTTTLDLPGTSGLFFRSEKRRSRGAQGVEHAAPRQPAGLALFFAFMLVQGLVYWAWASASCSGSIGRSLVFLLGIQAMAYTVIRVLNRVGTAGNVLLLLVMGIVGYFAAHAWIIC
jgi:hypothetical protein